MTSTDSILGNWAAKISTGLALSMGLAMVIALATTNRATDVPKITVGAKDTILYYRGVTKEDAIALGQALKATRYFTDAGSSILLAKDKGKGCKVVSFVLKDGAWDDPDAIFQFGEVGRRVAPSIGGFPLKVRLVNQKLVVEKDLAVGKETIGMRDTIYYYGSATSQDAVALGQSLRSAGAMKDAGATILLAKGDVTSVSFVVKESPWEQPQVVAAFEKVLRQVAPSVGGLPLKLRFLDPGGVMHREVSIL